MFSSRYGDCELLFLSWYDILPPPAAIESVRRVCSPPPQSVRAQVGRGTSSMLDNEDFVLDTSPRELTQNPLRKIWMPYQNGHIAQRRGKMRPSVRGWDREVMRRVSPNDPSRVLSFSRAHLSFHFFDIKCNI